MRIHQEKNAINAQKSPTPSTELEKVRQLTEGDQPANLTNFSSEFIGIIEKYSLASSSVAFPFS